ncbi:MAG: class D beta-lactamase, partial [Rhodospirillales bacterium]|nr:class D beta-lactamase [Rhodospirillales bacterium]
MSKRISRCMASAAIVASSLSLLGSVALAQSSAGQYQEMPGFKRFFDNAGVEGTIIVHDLRKGTSVVYNPARADTGFLPASTFKIPNSLIALDLDIVKDVDGDIFKWSGKPFTWDREAVLVEGKPILPEACNADITLRTAFPNSCVPVYQDIARKVGAERYKGILSSINYGNVDISSVAIDRFWLEGKLRISARHQIEFLKKLYREDLPFSKHAMRQVKDIMTAEKTAT